MVSSGWETLLPPTWKEAVHKWLDDDIPKFDVGGFVVGEAEQRASLLAKAAGVLAGQPFATAVFEHLGCVVEWAREEGSTITPAEAQGRTPIATVTGPTRALLLGERTALNILSRASGVATATRAAVELTQSHGWHGAVAGTRKTTPGFGLVEKYSILVGGGDTHRMDLSGMVMLKDNHIWSTGSITASVERARSACGFSTKIEVECTSVEDGMEAAKAGADVIMLDNFTAETLPRAASVLKEAFPRLITGLITQGVLGVPQDPFAPR
jgi:nicotinate-nucleotide pyrophosphorylase (carboxylating)